MKPDRRNLIIFSRSQNKELINKRIEELGEELRHSTTASLPKQRMAREVLTGRRNALRAAERTLKYGSTSAPSIFLSYSGLGLEYADLAKRKAAEYGFSVKTGFDKEVDIGLSEDEIIDPTLPQLIISQIISSPFFLGIWTTDFDGANAAGRDARGNYVEPYKGFLPSVWMPFELGVAAAHDVKIRLLIQTGTHKGYYEKPFNLKPNLLFTPLNFSDKLESVMRYFDRRMKSQIMAGT